MKNESFQDKDWDFERLYIIKSIDKEKILLSNHSYLTSESVQIIEDKEFLTGKIVHTEYISFKTTILQIVNGIKKIRREKQASKWVENELQQEEKNTH
ncbi:hypothetical protein RZN22_13870 [Bacillaceae bacterium S4-13-58]